MGTLIRCAVGLALVASLALPAAAQGDRCTHAALRVDGTAVAAAFCVPATPGGSSVNVTETFVVGGKTVTHVVTLAIVAGARISRTIDDVDLSPLGIARSLHATLAYADGFVKLEHALALPGATPVK
jgi:hypothetical protein